MKLVPFKEQTMVIAKDQPQYNPMPAHVSPDGRVVCCWQLTWRERVRVLLGGRVWHQIRTFHGSLQPQLLSLDKPTMHSESNFVALYEGKV